MGIGIGHGLVSGCRLAVDCARDIGRIIREHIGRVNELNRRRYLVAKVMRDILKCVTALGHLGHIGNITVSSQSASRKGAGQRHFVWLS